MRTIELPELPNARDLQARYGVSCTWLERHIQGQHFPQPIKIGRARRCCQALASLHCAHVGNPLGQNTLQELVRPARPRPGRAQ